MRISKANKIRNAFILLVILLFFVSSFSSIVFGYNDRSTSSSESAISDYPPDLDRQLENLAFYCTTPYGFNEQKYNHYKERLLNYYSSEILNDDKIIETDKEESKIQFETTSKPLTIGPMNSAWPMQSHDNHHTGLSPYNTNDNPYIEKWRFKSDWIESTPVIDSNGNIYFASDDRAVVAVYPNGTLKWRFNTGGNMLGSSPALAEDGTIYVGSWDTKLYAINPDGTKKWATGSGGSISSSPAIAEDGTIYFGTMSSGNSIIAMDPNGTIKWKYQTGYSVVSSPAIADDGTIYIGSGDTYFYAINPNGTLKWRFKTGDYIKGPASIADDGSIYVGSYDDYLYALYPNGTMKWKCSIGTGTETNPSIASDGTIYVGSPDGHLYAIYPNGTIKWSFAVIGNIHQSSPAISAEGTIYFGTDDSGYIYAVNPDGTKKWCKKIAKYWVESSPSIAEDGTVYIGSTYMPSRGYLHAFGSVESNSPPEAPSISGKSNGNVGVEYWYTFVSHDPDNNPIRLFVDWGDGSSGWVEWVDWFASGEDMWAEHTWTEQGTYIIKAKVQDVLGEESGWSYFDVTMSRSRIISKDFFLQFLQNHPHMFPFIRFLLKM